MPLQPGTSRAVFSGNVREMVNAGHKLKQALAAAYRERGEELPARPRRKKKKAMMMRAVPAAPDTDGDGR